MISDKTHQKSDWILILEIKTQNSNPRSKYTWSWHIKTLTVDSFGKYFLRQGHFLVNHINT